MSATSILAVDDDPVNLHIIEAIFEDSGFTIHFAPSGARALEILADDSHEIDVVLLDRMMPGIDGVEVLRRIKATPRLAGIPVVMQTAAATPEQVEEGLRAGAHYYLTKPYAPAALRTIVQAALEDVGRRRKLAERIELRGDALRFANAASFSFRAIDEAAELAELLAALCPDPGIALTGLHELLVNAVEHGNLGISYAEKSQLKREERWREEVERRANLAGLRQRRVQVGFERRPDALCFTIRDEGAGFDWKRYLELDPARVFDPNGRGIALARALSFSTLHYEARGNVAIATIARA